MANDNYIPTQQDEEEYQRYLEDTDQAEWWAYYEQEYNYFVRVAESNPRDSHWELAVKTIKQMTGEHYG